MRPEAHEPPMGDGHFLDQDGFDGTAGLVGGVEGLEEFVETVFGLGVEDYGAGQDAVMERVFAGIAFAFGRDRPSGFGSVDTGSLDLTFGAHFDFVIAWVVGNGGGIRGRFVDFRGDIKFLGVSPIKALWATNEPRWAGSPAHWRR